MMGTKDMRVMKAEFWQKLLVTLGFVATLPIFTAMLTGGAVAAENTITGAGATFPQPIYAKWAEIYQKSTQTRLNYQAIGSGGGLKQILAKTVDFGASDIPQTIEWQVKNGVIQFPAIIGGIIPAVHLDGIKPGTLKLTGEILADIYLGRITKWNDPAIAKLNKDLHLPNQNIAVIYRNDGSGTTYNLSYYLAQKSAVWKEKIGIGNALEWPIGFGAKGNDGVATLVKQQNGAIGYLEYGYVKQQALNYALLENAAGKFPQPNLVSFEAAAANADWDRAPGFNVTLTDAPGDKSWPITATSFILVPSTVNDPTHLVEVLKFFSWAFQNGQQTAHDLDYATLPSKLVTRINEVWYFSLSDREQKPIWTKKPSK